MDDSNRDGLKPKFPELPRLKIRSDVLKVARGPVFNTKGDKAEPEQQPAQRVMTVEGGAPVSGSRDAKQLGAIPMQIVAETDAGTAALAMRSKCFLCKNFDTATWKKLRLFWGNSSDKELFEKLNRVRMALLTTRNMEISRRSEGQDGDFDVEHAITQLGICQPLTELQGAAVIVSPISTCPDHVCSKERPTGLFTPKDREHEKMGSDAYDAIMKVALQQTKV